MGGGTRDSNLWLHRGKVSDFPMGGGGGGQQQTWGGEGFFRNHGGVGTPDMVHLDVGEKISEGGKIGWTMGKILGWNNNDSCRHVHWLNFIVRITTRMLHEQN